MKPPPFKGIIDRRILINYKVENNVLRRLLPSPFSPRLINGYGIAGVCLIRRKQLKINSFPSWMSVNTETALYRIAVTWEQYGKQHTGSYVLRKETDSLMQIFANSRWSDDSQNWARFHVKEEKRSQQDVYEINCFSKDGTSLAITANTALRFPQESVLKTLDTASCFFEDESHYISPKYQTSVFNCLSETTLNWKMSPLSVGALQSDFFENKQLFPKGSIYFDHALLMKNVRHFRNQLPDILAPRPIPTNHWENMIIEPYVTLKK